MIAVKVRRRKKKVSPNKELVTALKSLIAPNIAEINEQPWELVKHGVTQSMLGVVQSCPQKGKLKYRDSLVVASFAQPHPMKFGNFFHAALQRAYAGVAAQSGELRTREGINLMVSYGGKAVVDLYHQEVAIAKNVEIEEKQDFEMTYGKTTAMLPHYFSKWPRDVFRDWVAVEKPFVFLWELRDGTIVPVRGKFDGIFRQNGRLWLFETKTKTQFDPKSIADKLSIDTQTLLYFLAIHEEYGEWPAGVLYNIIKRPGITFCGKDKGSIKNYIQRVSADVADNIPKYFVRLEATCNSKHIEHWRDSDFTEMMEKVYSWSKGEGIYRNSFECLTYGTCEYLPLCSGRIDEKSYVRKIKVFPELEEGGED